MRKTRSFAMLAAAAITSGCSGASVDPMQQQSIIAQSKEAVRARLAQPDAALTDVFMRKTNISRFTLPVHIVCGKARSASDNLIVNQRFYVIDREMVGLSGDPQFEEKWEVYCG